MPKDVFCEMCDKFFPLVRDSFCVYCGMTLRRADGSLVTQPAKRQPSAAAVDPVEGKTMSDHAREKALPPAAVSPQPEPPRIEHLEACRIRMGRGNFGCCCDDLREAASQPPAVPEQDGIHADCWYCMKPGFLYRHSGGYNISMCDACRDAACAVPVQDALTTLVATWKKKAINSNRGSSNTYAACAEQLEAALRREPPAVKEPVKP